MTKLTHNLIQRWKSHRNRKMLQSPYSAKYAFIGVGSHALQNLYPVLDYLGIRLKYICCRNPGKLPLIEKRFGVKATTSPDDILNDNEIKGVIICTSPESHYLLCQRVIKAGKYAFVEKPPCHTLEELEDLIDADKGQKVMVGLQKRYSPYIRTLKSKLTVDHPTSYNLVYHTGAYPEGNPLTDLFIHAIDLSTYLFGNADIKESQRVTRNGATTIQILLSHHTTIGFIELSTAYSWTKPEETLRVNTASGEYRLTQMEKLCRYPHPEKYFGIPVEKIGLFTGSEEILMERGNFTPLVINNQLFSHGFISELESFAKFVEYHGKNQSPLSSLRETYRIITNLQTE